MYDIFLELLKSKNLKCADVSRATGIPSSTFTDWKNGKSKPKEEKLKKMADFLGVTTEYLRTGQETGNKPFSGFDGKDPFTLVNFMNLESEKKEIISEFIDIARYMNKENLNLLLTLAKKITND